MTEGLILPEKQELLVPPGAGPKMLNLNLSISMAQPMVEDAFNDPLVAEFLRLSVAESARQIASTEIEKLTSQGKMP